jgi:hypothetical protein
MGKCNERRSSKARVVKHELQCELATRQPSRSRSSVTQAINMISKSSTVIVISFSKRFFIRVSSESRFVMLTWFN